MAPLVTLDNGKNSILDRIVTAKRNRIEDDKATAPLSAMIAGAEEAVREVPALRFDEAIGLNRSVSVIAEMKRSSPSAGVMDTELDACRTGRSLQPRRCCRDIRFDRARLFSRFNFRS